MTGRELFGLLEPPMLVVAFLLRLLPRQFSYILYWMASSIPGSIGRGLRYPIAKRLAAKCGKNVALAERVVILSWSGLSIGDNVQIHPFCYIDGTGGVEIGNNVSIAHASSILSFDHTWADSTTPIKYNPLKLSEVSIADDVWIGCGVRVLAGTSINSRCIFAAGCVATAGSYTSGIYAGMPAKKIKSLE